MKNSTLALLILAAIFALVSVSGVQTHKAYTEQVADDKSFTVQVPGEYRHMENLEYLRQKYDVSGNVVLGFGVPESRGLIVIRKIMDEVDPAITSDEFLDAVASDPEAISMSPEKVIINDVPFVKTENLSEHGMAFITYTKQSIYVFTFDTVSDENNSQLESEMFNVMNSLKFNPDPNI